MFSFSVSLTPKATEGSGYADTSKTDGRVKLNVGCIRVVYLHKLVMALLVGVLGRPFTGSVLPSIAPLVLPPPEHPSVYVIDRIATLDLFSVRLTFCASPPCRTLPTTSRRPKPP